MKIKLLLAVVLCAILASCNERAGGGSAEMKTQMDSVSYIVGSNMGKQLKEDSLELNIVLLEQGIKDGRSGDTTKRKLTDSQSSKVMEGFQQQLMAKQQQAQERKGKANEDAGASFLAENKKKPGVTETASGLQYEVITPGTGKTPTDQDQVQVHYKGTLLDGTVFDSSIDRGEPVTFGVTGVIPGWTEALKLMKEGAKWKIYVPGKLAYGPTPPPGDKIQPNSTLIFEVELLKVMPGSASGGPGAGGPGAGGK